jgi:transposase
MMRSVLAELGTAIPVGIVKALQMAREIADGESELDLPSEAANVVAMLAGQLLQLHAQLRKLDLRLAALQRSDERARRLATIPGIGPIGATALAASVTDPSQFSSGREFAAWLGLTPRQSSSGGKERLGRITKMGDRYLRQLLVVGATALVRYAKQKPGTVDPRFVALLARKPARARRLGRHRQQDGPDRMGGDGARRRLRTRACANAGGSIDQELSGGDQLHEVVRAKDVMAKPVGPGARTTQ